MKICLLLFLSLIPVVALAQKPEKQVSFAMEVKPHTYYVEQAELWWKEIQRDSTSESNWYNYFRACRNAQGSDNWKSDFVNESPYLRTGDDIVKLMEAKIPDSFTFNYLSYLNHGVGKLDGDKLLKAYRMNPTFEGIHSSVVSYAISSFDTALRREANKTWYRTNYLSPALLNYAYNVLMSVDTNGILLTQNDNDTYPVWMLQDALGIRPDVTVINIDFLLADDYREVVFKRLGLDSLAVPYDLDHYENNWSKVVRHILSHYSGKSSVYVGMTLYQDLYKDFADRLVLSGLTFKRADKKSAALDTNRNLFEQKFLLDYLDHSFYVDRNEGNVVQENLNYLNMFKEVYDSYRKHARTAQAKKVKSLALAIVARTGKPGWTKEIEKEFK